MITRMVYRPEQGLHLGHLSTLYYNQHFVEHNGNGRCYIVVDDLTRDHNSVAQMIRELSWLNYSNLQIVRLGDCLPRIYELTENLIRSGEIHAESCQHGLIQRYREDITLDIFREIIRCPTTESYHLKLHSIDSERNYTIFRNIQNESNWGMDYLITLVDYLYQVNTLINFSKTNILNYDLTRDVYRMLKYPLPKMIDRKPLRIQGFQYNLEQITQYINRGLFRDWNDQRLLTLSSLERRGIPPEILKMFLEHLIQKEQIHLDVLWTCIRDSCRRFRMILDQPEVLQIRRPTQIIDYLSIRQELFPISHQIYLDHSQIPPENHPFRLKYLEDVRLSRIGSELIWDEDNSDNYPELDWLSVDDEYRLTPIQLVFPDRFYTGLQEPKESEQRPERHTWTILKLSEFTENDNHIYHIESEGYFAHRVQDDRISFIQLDTGCQ